jgi:hypothetical protein
VFAEAYLHRSTPAEQDMTKRGLNELLFEDHRGRADPDAVGFFCECPDPACRRAIWLTTAEYDQASTTPGRPALVGREHG